MENKAYDIVKMRDALKMLQNDEYEQGYELFAQQLAGVPVAYYSNIFFPCKAGRESVIVTDIRVANGDIYFMTRPLGQSLTKKTVRFDEYKAFSVEVARNIISAIEVAEYSRRGAEKEEEKLSNIKREIEEANIRKTL